MCALLKLIEIEKISYLELELYQLMILLDLAIGLESYETYSPIPKIQYCSIHIFQFKSLVLHLVLRGITLSKYCNFSLSTEWKYFSTNDFQ